MQHSAAGAFDLDSESFQQIPAEFFSEEFESQWLEVFAGLSSYQNDEVRSAALLGGRSCCSPLEDW